MFLVFRASWRTADSVRGLICRRGPRRQVGVRPIDPYLLEQSRINKRKMNHAEVRFWWDLRGNQFGVKFRRQHVAYGYLLDFACVPIKLDVETDGSQHEDSESDRRRDVLLESHGWTILRFWSWDIFHKNEMVINTISAAIEDLQRGTHA